MGKITNLRTALSYTAEAETVKISNSNANYAEDGKVTNFNGTLESADETNGKYAGSFNYSEQNNGRINMNIDIDASLYAAATALVIASVDDIKAQMKNGSK